MSETPGKNQNRGPTQDQQKTQKRGGEPKFLYKIRFRDQGREFSAISRIKGLKPGEAVMASTDHGLEPAVIVWRGPVLPDGDKIGQRISHVIIRRCNREEAEKRLRLSVMEQEATGICRRLIARLNLPMHLVRVERFCNGSKIIFYFTAEKRVDFRELVKLLVQEFRTRVEMRQIGVRHETQMIGGLGLCGRELCCSSHLRRFESVSIKMAKNQDLPLNPAKISGLCNRLLCCLTYEVKSYRRMKKEMPRVGSTLYHDCKKLRVVRQMTLQQTILAVTEDREEVSLVKEEWRAAVDRDRDTKEKGGKKSGTKAANQKKTES